MKLLLPCVILTWLIILVECFFGCRTITERVMTGQTQLYLAPWAVSLSIELKDGRTSTCSGVLFKPGFVLTNAHCLENAKPGGWKIFAGMGLNEVSTGVVREVKSFVIHHKYATNTKYDVGIVLLNSEFEYKEGLISAITFAQDVTDLDFTGFTDCQFAGTGETINVGNECIKSSVMRYLSGIPIALSCCNEINRLANSPSKIPFPLDTACFFSNIDMACKGDSGAGITCKAVNKVSNVEETVLIGLIRAGEACCDVNDKKINSPLPRNFVPTVGDISAWISEKLVYYINNGKLE